MKRLFTFLGIAGLIIVALTATRVAAQSPQPTPTVTATVVAATPAPQLQSTPAAPQANPNAGTRRCMMCGGMMGGRMGMGGMSGHMQMHGGSGMMQGSMTGTAGWGYGMNHESMMYGVTPMHDDIASYLGMTTQELYNQMAAGKSLVQIAAQKGITEQQLMDAIMAGRRAAYDQAVKGGYMTQAQADAMLQNMNNNLKNMVNSQGYGSGGWGMMWDDQTTPQKAP